MVCKEDIIARALLDAAALPLDADSIRLDPALGSRRIEAKGLEERMIREALDFTAGHIGRASARIGWSRQKLYRRMSALGIRTAQSTRRDLESTTSSANSTFQ